MKDSPSFKKLSAIAFMFGAIGISGGAMAGWKEPKDAPRVHANEYIEGNFAGARNSNNNVEWIAAYDYGTYMYIAALQYDSVFSGCITYEETVMAQLRAANSDATLYAGVNNGKCENVYVTNGSFTNPKDH